MSPVHVARRHGIKGADAAAWLVTQGVPVPDAPNRVRHWPGGRCLRLGSTEFLVEHDDAASAPALDERDEPGRRAWLLLRSDHSLLLDPHTCATVLPQVCSFDFTRLRDEPGLVVMTLLAGISVTLVREPLDASPVSGEPGTQHAPMALRLWCDASYATFLERSLQQLAAPSPLGEQR